MLKNVFSENRWRSRRRARVILHSESLQNSNKTSTAGASGVESSPSNNSQPPPLYSSWPNETVSESRLDLLYKLIPLV